ncbi:MAG TPA: response regulator, partial [Dissulfurispiraceae bacterium]|nr:response regulator [Dissulfurispiraceae bacterium]
MKLKVLVVDDEPDICKALVFLLKQENYAVTTANSGEQALGKLNEEHFDVVLTDLKMGQIDGMGVLEKVRET